MKKIFNKIKNFFEVLRQKPESERQKWLWVFIAVSLLIVVVFWLFILKKDMQVIGSTPSPTPIPTAMSSGNNSGFIYTFKIGWEKTSTFVVEKCKAIGEAIGNFLASIFSYSFQGWKKALHYFSNANNYLEREFSAYFKALGLLISGEL